MPKAYPALVAHRETGELAHHDQGVDFPSLRAAERFRQAQEDRDDLVVGRKMDILPNETLAAEIIDRPTVSAKIDQLRAVIEKGAAAQTLGVIGSDNGNDDLAARLNSRGPTISIF